MENEDLPTWVPSAVRRAAAVYGAGHPLIERLLSAPTMGRVWTYFETHPVKDDFRTRFYDGTGLMSPDLRDFDLHWHDTPAGDQALVFVFYAALVAANNSREIPDQRLIDAEIVKLQETQRLLHGLRAWAPWPTLKVEPNIDRAIIDITALCDERIALLNYKNKPSVVEVKGPESTIKSTIRAIGAATHALYGECCYTQLAKMANVMFSPVEPIKSGDVGHWCTRPRLPLMEKENGRAPRK